MLRIVCIDHGDYQGRGAEYTNILHDSVRRNLPAGFPGLFEVLTDDPARGYAPGIVVHLLPNYGLRGWWNKLQMFAPGTFPAGDRILYLDLDTAVTGDLAGIAAYSGTFAILRDFYRPRGLQSSVMAWEAGTHLDLWESYALEGYPQWDPRGDQGWLEDHLRRTDTWQALFPKEFCSYKLHASESIPLKAKVVVFHGQPRPHDVRHGWVPKVWRVGGGTAVELVVEANVSRETIQRNIKHALTLNCSWLQMHPARPGAALICAGGPSLTAELGLVHALQRGGAEVFAVNGARAFLEDHGVGVDSHVMLDARSDNRLFVPRMGGHNLYYASQCHPEVLAAAQDVVKHDGARLICYHPYFDGIKEIVGADDQSAFIGGGTTAGLKAVCIAYVLGYRAIHLFGFDSCYVHGSHHAYPQALNDGEKLVDVECGDETFSCAPWQATQAQDFQGLMPELVAMGAEIHVHGAGLIPAIARQMAAAATPAAADYRAWACLSRLVTVEKPRVAEIGVFAGDLSKRLLAQRPDLHLTMIDAWQGDRGEDGTADFHNTLSQQEQDDYAEFAAANVSFARGRYEIVRKLSHEAAKDLADGSLDLAFIDADHSYEGCARDIAAYWPKVKPGGWLSGHDYANNDYPFGPMVKRAVDEFVGANAALALELDSNYTWFVVKPNEETTP